MHFIEEKAMTLTLFDGSMAREIEPLLVNILYHKLCGNEKASTNYVFGSIYLFKKGDEKIFKN